ncbi:outer membrane protein [Myxosarcina sp. GI1]|uniref:outer membrane protein n=1 Tax=Myxosarcina sp. GI1 TaxID=1541065 RepID=UPI00068F3E96|nr:outer membrane beta-barrel protein [Myxosarcina sp. GI1]
MSFKLVPFVPIAAGLAILATPLVASAQTNISGRENNYSQTTVPHSYPDTINPQDSTDYPVNTPQDSFDYEKPVIPQNQNYTNSSETTEPIVPNYVGLGGSNRGIALDSKFALSNRFSIRPMAIGDLDSDNQNGDFTVPVTYDFQPVFGNKLQPYAGAGLGGSTENDGSVGGVITAGVDYPINKRLTANANINYDAFGNDDTNAVVGVAANFNG